MRDLLRTAALVGAAIITVVLAVERAYAAPILAEVEGQPCLCDPATKTDMSVAGASFAASGGAAAALSVIDSFPGVSTMTLSLAALDGRVQGQVRTLSVSTPKAHVWLSDKLGGHLQLGLVPAALPLLGIGFAALGLLARRRTAGEWQILDSD